MDTQQTKKHIHVVAGVIEHDGKILCMERPRGKFDYVSFKFEFPGGKIEAGASSQTT
jgi:8-oxo-dGTP diphosphatase